MTPEAEIEGARRPPPPMVIFKLSFIRANGEKNQDFFRRFSAAHQTVEPQPPSGVSGDTPMVRRTKAFGRRVRYNNPSSFLRCNFAPKKSVK